MTVVGVPMVLWTTWDDPVAVLSTKLRKPTDEPCLCLNKSRQAPGRFTAVVPGPGSLVVGRWYPQVVCIGETGKGSLRNLGQGGRRPTATEKNLQHQGDPVSHSGLACPGSRGGWIGGAEGEDNLPIRIASRPDQELLHGTAL